jgi:luciferase family oxidoreductase group 1
MKLSVLDQSVSLDGSSEDAAIRDTLSLAVDCEQLGYSRFWVSEHHGLPTIVGSAPEILMAAIAARTTRIRIGSAGVMLPHYSALKVAEQFRVLEALAPGRIDLGLGRAPGGDMRTARALNPNASHAAEDFPVQVRDLHAWTSLGTHAGITAHPRGSHAPEIWILGSSDYGAQLAAHFGLPYAFAYFFTDGQGAETAMALYRERYQPSERHPEPQSTLCIWALAAESDEEAAHLALSRDRWRVDRQRGALGPLQAPDAIAARGFSEAELAMLAPMRSKAFVGSPATVGAKIRQLASDYGLDELVINTWAHDPAVRRRSYALLAAEFGLAAAAPLKA